MTRNEQLLEEGSFPRLFFSLCVPTILIMLVMVLYNMADTFFIGQTGDPDKIAALSLCAPLFSILSGLGTLLGSGGCTFLSLAFGRKDFSRIKACTSFCCDLHGAWCRGCYAHARSRLPSHHRSFCFFP